jgi:hypothetical protein
MWPFDGTSLFYSAADNAKIIRNNNKKNIANTAARNSATGSASTWATGINSDIQTAENIGGSLAAGYLGVPPPTAGQQGTTSSPGASDIGTMIEANIVPIAVIGGGLLLLSQKK